MSIQRTIIIITLADAASPHETRPPEIRLRAVLKLLLRGYGLRCVNIQPAVPDDHAGQIRQHSLDYGHVQTNKLTD